MPYGTLGHFVLPRPLLVVRALVDSSSDSDRVFFQDFIGGLLPGHLHPAVSAQLQARFVAGDARRRRETEREREREIGRAHV